MAISIFWLNILTFLYHVQAGSERHITNFGSDIKDSEIYTELISQIAPKNVGVNKTALQYEVYHIFVTAASKTGYEVKKRLAIKLTGRKNQGGRGHWAFYYTSPRIFIMMIQKITLSVDYNYRLKRLDIKLLINQPIKILKKVLKVVKQTNKETLF